MTHYLPCKEKNNGPTKLSIEVLREIIKVFHEHSNNNKIFRPCSRYGGKGGKNNHLTKEGLYKTACETLNVPEILWIEPDYEPNNNFLKQLSLRQNWQKRSVAERIRSDFFKPILMNGREDFCSLWLSGDQITDIVRKATKRNRSFHMLGSYSPDSNGTKWLIKSYDTKSTYKTYGIVWNTNSLGSHWIAVLLFPYKNYYEYFDSTGNQINNTVREQLKQIKVHMSSKKWVHPMWIHTKHQSGGNQCGMYAAWYIIERIVKGITYEEIQKDPVEDSQMMKIREKYFRKPTKEIINLLPKYV